MIKKICNVDEDGRFGGPQQRMLVIASELKKKNIDVEIIIPKDETEIFKKKLLECKIKFYELNITRLSLRLNFLIKYIFLFFYEIFLLVKFFKKNKYDLIQANSTPQYKAVIAAFLLNLKVVWVIEDSYFPFIIVFFFIPSFPQTLPVFICVPFLPSLLLSLIFKLTELELALYSKYPIIIDDSGSSRMFLLIFFCIDFVSVELASTISLFFGSNLNYLILSSINILYPHT